MTPRPRANSRQEPPATRPGSPSPSSPSIRRAARSCSPGIRWLFGVAVRAALAKTGLGRLRPYDLRHSAASLLLAADEHPKVVQEMLGHASITLTLQTNSQARAHPLPSNDAPLDLEASSVVTDFARPALDSSPLRGEWP